MVNANNVRKANIWFQPPLKYSFAKIALIKAKLSVLVVSLYFQCQAIGEAVWQVRTSFNVGFLKVVLAGMGLNRKMHWLGYVQMDIEVYFAMIASEEDLKLVLNNHVKCVLKRHRTYWYFSDFCYLWFLSSFS